MSEDRQRPTPPQPERQGVQGGDRDVATDQKPPSSGVPSEPSSEAGLRGEEERDRDQPGGMAGEGF
jgi:hypothetical protein